ncbi:hypothetical protein Sru01_67500 [Sphaerisporangium rufum]|uniref:Uncharacterized protein n=1 Tax=Sphaerisporangium rufum TaxID=1381558 RepID=A0A919R9L2_9ACTN|nr:hypothetical protein Sru01_67500 [Sphaerisporangium rufum]
MDVAMGVRIARLETTASTVARGRPRSLARLHPSVTNPTLSHRGWWDRREVGSNVKKLLVLALVALGGLLVWRKVQADRAELDLWTEATGSEN